MKFPGKCVVCGEKIGAGEAGLWARGVGVRHKGCAEAKKLECAVCGGQAGCASCEMRDDCDIELVSDLCICKACSARTDAFFAYKKATTSRFPILDFTNL